MSSITLSRPQSRIYESGKAHNLCMFGQGSGKTLLAGLISGRFIIKCKGIPGFIAANTYRQLNDSTMKNIRKAWREVYGWKEYSISNTTGKYIVGKKPPQHFKTENHDFDSYSGIISFIDGTYIFYGSLDNYKAHDGKEFGWAILDETKDTKEEAITDVILGRLRIPGLFYHYALGWNTKGLGGQKNPLYIFTTPAKVDWLNEFFNLPFHHDDIIQKAYSETDYFHNIDNDLNQCVCIASTYHNQKNLTPGYIETNFGRHSEAKRKMLVYAIPFAKSGGEFYKSFEIGKHGNTEIAFNPELPIHISHDFNVAPYITLTCYQRHEDEKHVYFDQFDEFCLPSPHNNTRSVTEAFCRKYPNVEIISHGDPSGKQRDTRTKSGRNDFHIIEDVLKEHGIAYKMKQTRKAPGIVARGNFANAVFEGKAKTKEGKTIVVRIGKQCKKSVADFLYVKESDDGTKKKIRIKDPDDPQITYEKYGHTSDSFDYAFTTVFEKEFLASMGKKVWRGTSL